MGPKHHQTALNDPNPIKIELDKISNSSITIKKGQSIVFQAKENGSI